GTGLLRLRRRSRAPHHLLEEERRALLPLPHLGRNPDLLPARRHSSSPLTNYRKEALYAAPRAQRQEGPPGPQAPVHPGRVPARLPSRARKVFPILGAVGLVLLPPSGFLPSQEGVRMTTTHIGYGQFHLEQFLPGEEFARYDGTLGKVCDSQPYR